MPAFEFDRLDLEAQEKDPDLLVISGTGMGVGRGRTLAEVFVIPATYDLAHSLWAHSGFFVKFFSSGQMLTALSTRQCMWRCPAEGCALSLAPHPTQLLFILFCLVRERNC